jgi:hypothetical protein
MLKKKPHSTLISGSQSARQFRKLKRRSRSSGYQLCLVTESTYNGDKSFLIANGVSSWHNAKNVNSISQ